MGFSLVHSKIGNLWNGKFSIFPEELFIHGISSRNGGVSKGDYASLNLGLHVGDEEEAVLKNRQLFCHSLGIDFQQVITCQQVHDNVIRRVGKAELGLGAREYALSIAGVDGLITNEREVPLMLFFADCTPVLLADPVKKAIGIAHGGWKGTLGGIAAGMVLAMAKEFGSKPEDLLAAVGPAIGSCCYETGEEVVLKFRQAYPEISEEFILEKNGKAYLDLWQANRLQLEHSGVKRENIEVAGVCTACNKGQFFSYRGDKGKTGRIAALLSIR